MCETGTLYIIIPYIILKLWKKGERESENVLHKLIVQIFFVQFNSTVKNLCIQHLSDCTMYTVCSTLIEQTTILFNYNFSSFNVYKPFNTTFNQIKNTLTERIRIIIYQAKPWTIHFGISAIVYLFSLGFEFQFEHIIAVCWALFSYNGEDLVQATFNTMYTAQWMYNVHYCII